MNQMKPILATFIVMLLSGCIINRPISYEVDDLASNQADKTMPIILDIENFIDKRKENPANELLYTQAKSCRIDGNTFCINAERNYKNEPVNKQVTQMLVHHLNKRGLTQMVLANRKDTADYYITGNLTKFYGQQEFSQAAAVGAQFGLIGALATMGAKTKGEIIFEITELKLYNKQHQLVKDWGNFKREYKGEFPADAYCWCIFENVNNKLKEYFNELATMIETDISVNEKL